MNQTQKDLLEYMQEVLHQEDVHFSEAWETVKFYVMDALSSEEETEQ